MTPNYMKGAKTQLDILVFTSDAQYQLRLCQLEHNFYCFNRDIQLSELNFTRVDNRSIAHLPNIDLMLCCDRGNSYSQAIKSQVCRHLKIPSMCYESKSPQDVGMELGAHNGNVNIFPTEQLAQEWFDVGAGPNMNVIDDNTFTHDWNRLFHQTYKATL